MCNPTGNAYVLHYAGDFYFKLSSGSLALLFSPKIWQRCVIQNIMRGQNLLVVLLHIILSYIYCPSSLSFQINIYYLHIFLGSTSIKSYAACIREAKWPFWYIFIGALNPLVHMKHDSYAPSTDTIHAVCTISFLFIYYSRGLYYIMHVYLACYRRHRYRITIGPKLSSRVEQAEWFSLQCSEHSIFQERI